MGNPGDHRLAGAARFRPAALVVALLLAHTACGGAGSGVVETACTEGDRRCDADGGVEVCHAGAYVWLEDCPAGSLCDAGLCVDEETCTPDCGGRLCGDDGCGGSCGVCDGDETCTPDGECIDGQSCEPIACEDVVGACGTLDDGCGRAIACGACPCEGDACETGDPEAWVVLAAWESNCVEGTSAAPSTASAGNADSALTAHGVRETAANHEYHSFVCISNAYSTKHWNNTDFDEKYWQVRVSTLGYEDVRVSSRQSGSNTGPRDFSLEFSTDGLQWTDAGLSITVATDWETGVVEAAPLPSDFEDQSEVYIRWILDEDSAAINGGDIGTTGAGRIDHVVVEGVPL
jgi:hypothetical protein